MFRSFGRLRVVAFLPQLALIAGGAALGLASACAQGSDPDLGDDPGELEGGASVDAPNAITPAEAGKPVPTDAAVSDAPADAPADACTTALSKITFDFEAGTSGWTHGTSDGATGSWPFDPWAHGTTTVGTACKAGKCFGTELVRQYAQCQRGYLLSPAVDLSACAGKNVSVVFHHAYAFFTGSYGGNTWSDGGIVEVSGNGSTWQLAQGTYPGTVKINPNRGASYACVLPDGFGVHNKQGYIGAQSTTVRAELVLPASTITSQTRLRFSFASGVSSQTTDANASRTSTAAGWRIDDVGFVVK